MVLVIKDDVTITRLESVVNFCLYYHVIYIMIKKRVSFSLRMLSISFDRYNHLKKSAPSTFQKVFHVYSIRYEIYKTCHENV